MTIEHFQNLVIGSGAAGKILAWTLGKQGQETVVVERSMIGGSCETRGFMKALIGADDRILGFTAFGAEASELMAVVQTAMLGRMPYTALREAIFTHPTAAEGLDGLFANPPSAPAPRETAFQGVA
jgi:pyruvate/2-oxoglutarate dehydrogenase complex dihydrolipoamide dehydrogenase (E3) component